MKKLLDFINELNLLSKTTIFHDIIIVVTPNLKTRETLLEEVLVNEKEFQPIRWHYLASNKIVFYPLEKL
jgi:hypothetical protein